MVIEARLNRKASLCGEVGERETWKEGPRKRGREEEKGRGKKEGDKQGQKQEERRKEERGKIILRLKNT